jgi:hypothetical protein
MSKQQEPNKPIVTQFNDHNSPIFCDAVKKAVAQGDSNTVKEMVKLIPTDQRYFVSTLNLWKELAEIAAEKGNLGIINILVETNRNAVLYSALSNSFKFGQVEVFNKIIDEYSHSESFRPALTGHLRMLYTQNSGKDFLSVVEKGHFAVIKALFSHLNLESRDEALGYINSRLQITNVKDAEVRKNLMQVFSCQAKKAAESEELVVYPSSSSSSVDSSLRNRTSSSLVPSAPLIENKESTAASSSKQNASFVGRVAAEQERQPRQSWCTYIMNGLKSQLGLR